MQFWILGPLEVTFRSQQVRVPGLRQRKILATLALHANTPVSVDRLIDVLWAEAPPKTAREQVQNCTGQLAQRLRTIAGRQLIIRHSRSYTLAVSEDSLDALRLAGAARRSRELAEAGRDTEAQRLRRAALDLWRGDALVDVLTDGMRARVLQLEQVRTGIVERYGETALSTGDHDGAIDELSSAVVRHPFNERLCELLMRALRESGRSAEALSTYSRMHDRLTRELGLRPGPALAGLHRKILHDSPRAMPQQPPQPRSLLVHPPQPLRSAADLEAVRLLREAAQLLSAALNLLESSLSGSRRCRPRPDCTIEAAYHQPDPPRTPPEPCLAVHPGR